MGWAWKFAGQVISRVVHWAPGSFCGAKKTRPFGTIWLRDVVVDGAGEFLRSVIGEMLATGREYCGLGQIIPECFKV